MTRGKIRQSWVAQEHSEMMRCESEHRADETTDPILRHRLLAVARLHDKIADSARRLRNGGVL